MSARDHVGWVAVTWSVACLGGLVSLAGERWPWALALVIACMAGNMIGQWVTSNTRRPL